MNIDRLQQKLLAAARAHRTRESVPYAFEQRVLARLKDAPAPDAWTYWGASLWRAAAPCVAIMLLLGVWTAVTSSANGSLESRPADLESTVWAPLEDVGDAW